MVDVNSSAADNEPSPKRSRLENSAASWSPVLQMDKDTDSTSFSDSTDLDGWRSRRGNMEGSRGWYQNHIAVYGPAKPH